MGIRAKSFATTFSGACMPHWRCRATDLLRLNSEKSKIAKDENYNSFLGLTVRSSYSTSLRSAAEEELDEREN